MFYIAQTALELGFLYALVAMALFLSYRVLDIADLTTDGAFVLGAAVSVSLAAAGHPVLAVPAAMAAGACAGFVTAFLQTKLGVPPILAGIVTNTGLYTVNLMAMGWKSNVSLLKQETVFSLFRATGLGGDWYETVLAAGITLLMGALLVSFLGTRLGLSIRATGDNRDMVRASSINPTFTVTVGLCISNSLTALSGAVVGQAQKSAAAPASWSSAWPASSSGRLWWAGALCAGGRWPSSRAASSTASSTPWCCAPPSPSTASSWLPPLWWRWPSPPRP